MKHIKGVLTGALNALIESGLFPEGTQIRLIRVMETINKNKEEE